MVDPSRSIGGSQNSNSSQSASAALGARAPANLAEAMVGVASGPQGVDTDALSGLVAGLTTVNPALGAQVRQQVEARLSPVDLGRLQGAMANQPGAVSFTVPVDRLIEPDPILAANPTYSYTPQGQLVDACGQRVPELRSTPVALQPRSWTPSDFVCSMPALGLGAGVSAYAGPGGGVAVGVSYDPKTGVLRLDGNAEAGVGIGFKAGSGGLTKSRDVERGPANSATRVGNDAGLSVGIGLSTNIQGGPLTERGEAELVGTNMDKSLPDRSKLSYGLGGFGLTANVNVNVAASDSWQVAEPNYPTPVN